MMNEIQIHAPFPRRFVCGKDIDIDASNWYWLHCLTIPVDDLPRFSIRPYKWLRFSIGVVLGAEGDLSSNPDSLNVIDYDAPLSLDSATLYYHLSDKEKQRMFPLDPLIAPSSITSSALTPRRAQFRSNVAKRDEKRCVVVGFGAIFCDAVHLVAHSKSDTYISNLTERRSRDPLHNDVIDSINSVRNGLFLNKCVHVSVGKEIGFLVTPNFAMDTPDVDPAGNPGEKRCTSQLFRDIEFGKFPSCSGPIRISDSPDWPPTILFDAVYASAVFRHFATQALKDSITLFDAYYPDGVVDRRVRSQEEIEERLDQRQERHDNRELEHRPDSMDMLFALPYICLPRDDVKAYFDHAEDRFTEEQQKNVEEKVESWRTDVCENTPGPQGLQ